MSDIDDKLAAAWRDASREEPPAALDDALRAAARRAVGAGPSRARHMQTWPLAAAAVVAVLAIGIVHMAPPEQVAPTFVADSTLRGAAVKENDAAPPPVAMNGAPRASEQVGAPAPVDRVTSAPRKQLAQPAKAPSPNLTVALPQPAPASGATGLTAGAVAQSPAGDSGATESKLEIAAPADLTKKSRAEPFPGAPVEGKNAADGISAAPPPAPAGAKPALAPPPENAIDARVARSDQQQLAGTATAAPTASFAKLAPERERAKDAAPRTPDQWIKLIRRLRGEGRKDDVSRELAAFRTEYKDRADALLPPDLREIK